jgi:hypothetical protein
VLTAGRPAVLVLEDLPWSAPSTAELLAASARRREAARQLLRTYRPVELSTTNQPLKAVKQEVWPTDSVPTAGERQWEAELRPLKGALTLQQARVSGFELHFQEKQKAKSKNYRPQPLIPAPESEAEARFHEAVEVARR